MMVRSRYQAGPEVSGLVRSAKRDGLVESRTTSRLPLGTAKVRCLMIVSLFLVHSTSLTIAQSLTVGQSTEVPDVTVEAAAPTLSELQTQAQLNIQRLNAVLSSQESANSNIAEYATEELQLWEELELVIDQRALIQQDLAALESLDAVSDEANIPNEELPKSYLEFEEFRNEVLSSERNLSVLGLELRAEKNMQARVSEQYRDAEKARRHLAEGLQSGELPELVRDHALAVLRSQVLAHRLAMHREQTAVTAKKIEVAEKDVAVRQGLQTALQGNFKLTEGELDSHLAKFGDALE